MYYLDIQSGKKNHQDWHSDIHAHSTICPFDYQNPAKNKW
jgi:hypothetical protein